MAGVMPEAPTDVRTHPRTERPLNVVERRTHREGLALADEPLPGPDLAHSARILIETALRLKADERFVIVADAASAEVGEALAWAGTNAGAAVTLARIDELRSVATGHSGERPHRVLPDVVRRGMLGSHASAFLASAPPEEHTMRGQLLQIVAACRVRHAHLPAVDAKTFRTGVRLDCRQIARVGTELTRKLDKTNSLYVESAAGTSLHVTLSKADRWVPRYGMVSPGEATAFPAGSLYLPVESVRGTFVANASLSDFFGARAGVLTQAPVTLTIEDGLVTRVDARNSNFLQRDVEAVLEASPNSNRIGLVALGVNPILDEPTGNAAVDQTLPGLHLVVGDASSYVAGVPFRARTSFIACSAGATVVARKGTVIEQGRLTL